MPNSSTHDRPGLAIVANTAPPYRVNLHRLLAAGIPELKLHTLVTHGAAEFDWKLDAVPEIHLAQFAEGIDSPLAGTFSAPLAEWRKGGRLLDYLKANDVRAVIVSGYRYISYLRTIQHCHHNGMPVFVTNDSNIRCEARISPWKQFVKNRVNGWWMRRVTGVMPMGEYGDQFFLKYGARADRMYRLPCTPDYESFAGSSPDRLEGFRQKFGLRPERRYLLYSGRLVPVKRVDLVMDAFAQLAAQRPDWDLLIVGNGHLRDELERRVPETLRSRVVWTGFLEQQDSILAFQAADVLALASDREPWALVVQEAMAAGLAVVASDVVGAAHDIIVDGESGRIFKAGDLKGLTEALLDVTRKERLRDYQEQSKRALQTWRERIDPVKEVRRALIDAGVLAR